MFLPIFSSNGEKEKMKKKLNAFLFFPPVTKHIQCLFTKHHGCIFCILSICQIYVLCPMLFIVACRQGVSSEHLFVLRSMSFHTSGSPLCSSFQFPFPLSFFSSSCAELVLDELAYDGLSFRICAIKVF